MNLERWFQAELKRQFRSLSKPVKFTVLLILAIIIGFLSLSNGTAEENLTQILPTPTPDIQRILSEASEQISRPDLSELDVSVVTRVVDGDTLVLETNERVRLIGIDTPETTKANTEPDCYGIQAAEFTKNLLENKTVYLQTDVSQTDRYNRLLRYVWLEEVMVNQLLIQQGYAQVATFPPDTKYQEIFLTDEAMARTAELGLWGEVCQE